MYKTNNYQHFASIFIRDLEVSTKEMSFGELEV